MSPPHQSKSTFSQLLTINASSRVYTCQNCMYVSLHFGISICSTPLRSIADGTGLHSLCVAKYYFILSSVNKVSCVLVSLSNAVHCSCIILTAVIVALAFSRSRSRCKSELRIRGEIWPPNRPTERKKRACIRDKSKLRNRRRRRVGGGVSVPAMKVMLKRTSDLKELEEVSVPRT